MLQIQVPQGSRHAESLFTKEERNKLASDVFAIFATHTVFMTSLIKTSEHKMAALTVAFL